MVLFKGKSGRERVSYYTLSMTVGAEYINIVVAHGHWSNTSTPLSGQLSFLPKQLGMHFP